MRSRQDTGGKSCARTSIADLEVTVQQVLTFGPCATLRAIHAVSINITSAVMKGGRRYDSACSMSVGARDDTPANVTSEIEQGDTNHIIDYGFMGYKLHISLCRRHRKTAKLESCVRRLSSLTWQYLLPLSRVPLGMSTTVSYNTVRDINLKNLCVVCFVCSPATTRTMCTVWDIRRLLTPR